MSSSSNPPTRESHHHHHRSRSRSPRHHHSSHHSSSSRRRSRSRSRSRSTGRNQRRSRSPNSSVAPVGNQQSNHTQYQHNHAAASTAAYSYQPAAQVATPAAHSDVVLHPPMHIRRQQIDASVPSATHAFVTLVMLGDSYVPGALVLGGSIRAVGSKASLVVMVTHDVSEAARKDLALVFDRVIEVPIIEARAIHQEWKRYTKGNAGAAPMYQWIDKSFTKFNVLTLTDYRRVCLLDADMLCVGQPDGIFALAAPAGICSTIADKRGNEEFHGRRLTQAQVEASWRSYGMRGCLYMLEPNRAHFELVQATLREHGGYGERRFFIGADEKLMTDLYLDQWTHAHWQYGCNSWKCSINEIGREPVFLHYVTEKPWQPKEVWPDTFRWNEHAKKIIQRHPSVEPRFRTHLEAIERHTQQKSNSNQRH